MEKETKIDGKFIVATKRKLHAQGGSSMLSVPKKWLDFKKLQGRPLDEVACIGNELMVICPPEKMEQAKKILERLEEELGCNSRKGDLENE